MPCELAWQHEALLRAGLTRGEEAIAAFREWRARVCLDDVDHESVRLLPAVYRSLVAHGMDDPILPRLRGVYRKTWTEGHLRARTQLAALSSLRQEGIPAVLARGAPLVARHLGDAGICAPAQAEVIVASRELPAAERALRAAGWIPRDDSAPGARPTRALELTHGDGTELVVHPGLPGGSTVSEDLEMEVSGGARVAVLDPAGQLLYACARDRSRQAVGVSGWALETTAVLRSQAVDWERLVVLSKAAGTPELLEARLSCLRHLLATAVPEDVLARLRDLAWEHALTGAGGRRKTLFRAWRQLRAEFASWDDTSPGRPAPSDFLHFLEARWGLTSSAKLPRAALARLKRIAFGSEL